MPRKRTFESVEKDLIVIAKSKEIKQQELDKVCKAEEKLIAEKKDLLEAMRRENTDKIGETVYKYFGENISPDKFAETVEKLLNSHDNEQLIQHESDITEEVMLIDKTKS